MTTTLTLSASRPAIPFSLPDQGGMVRSLADYRGRWLVLYFYPKDSTPGCTIEAVDFSDEARHFLELGADIVGVSPDSPKSHCSFIKSKKLRITLLCDETHTLLEKYSIWQKKKLYGREYLGVVRTTILIDPEGKIAHVWSPVDVKGHAKDVLATLGAQIASRR